MNTEVANFRNGTNAASNDSAILQQMVDGALSFSLTKVAHWMHGKKPDVGLEITLSV